MRVCKVDGCGNKAEVRGLCQKCYDHARYHGEISVNSQINRNSVCSEHDCEGKHYARGLCATCYNRERLRGHFTEEICKVESCERGCYAKNLCCKHYYRQLRYGSTSDAVLTRAPNGSGFKNNSGYIIIRIDSLYGRKQILEHRHIMSQSLGRELFPDETIHHLNGIRDDNRIENLELMSSSHFSGQRVKDKLAHARKMIERYGE